MRKDILPVYRPLEELAVERISKATVSLKSRRDRVQVSVLAADLFRLRMTSARQLSERPSWAVCKTDWPEIPTDIRANRGQVCVQTRSGKLTIRLADGGWRLQDQFGVELFASMPEATGFGMDGAQLAMRLQGGESLFGLGETTGTFNKRGLIREYWNTDVLGHAPAIHPSLRALYISIPFAISLRAGRAAGIFWDNPARQTWDLGQTQLDRWQMKAATGEIDLYLFIGPQVSEVVARYAELTGRIPLPPRWALGYQQCRYSYETRARVEQVAKDFRRRKIPCDVLYLDIHHMDGYRVFTFGKRFPAPAALMGKLARQGFKVVTIVDPGVKDDLKFGVLRRGVAAKAFVKASNSKTDFVGTVWPGKSRFPDFLNLRARRWWGLEQRQLTRLGVAGFWNDMNEPANFGLPIKTLPEECIHNTDFGPMHHGEAHNLYGMQMARASHEGALAHQPDRRPFVITRAGYAGVQRYALAWTGDNSSVWEHLADSVQMLLNLSVSGLAFCGADVGGFMDNTTPELLARWTQMAAFTPFFRNHSNINTIDQEPWALGARTEAICREYIEFRYRLLPYLYGLFVEAHRSGTPIMRPLFWHYQDDPIAVAVGDQFLLGRDLMVAPILRQGAEARVVYLPEGRWFNFWTGESHFGEQHIVAQGPLERIPLFTRAGAMISMGAVQQYVGENETGVINLHIWPGAPGEMTWYEDDGFSMAYSTGHVHQREITFTPSRKGGVVRFGAAHGSSTSQIKKWRVILHEATPKASKNSLKANWDFDGKVNLRTVEIRNSPTAMAANL
jgi:alpha-glucosidase